MNLDVILPILLITPFWSDGKGCQRQGLGREGWEKGRGREGGVRKGGGGLKVSQSSVVRKAAMEIRKVEGRGTEDTRLNLIFYYWFEERKVSYVFQVWCT